MWGCRGFKTLDVIDLSATLNSSKHQVDLRSICKWCVPYTSAFVWSVWRMVFIKKVLVSSKAVASWKHQLLSYTLMSEVCFSWCKQRQAHRWYPQKSLSFQYIFHLIQVPCIVFWATMCASENMWQKPLPPSSGPGVQWWYSRSMVYNTPDNHIHLITAWYDWSLKPQSQEFMLDNHNNFTLWRLAVWLKITWSLSRRKCFQKDLRWSKKGAYSLWKCSNYIFVQQCTTAFFVLPLVIFFDKFGG